MKISVKVHAGTKQEKIIISSDLSSAEIWTRAKAHDNEANEKVIEKLAKEFSVGKSKVKIMRGTTSKNKIVEVKN